MFDFHSKQKLEIIDKMVLYDVIFYSVKLASDIYGFQWIPLSFC